MCCLFFSLTTWKNGTAELKCLQDMVSATCSLQLPISIMNPGILSEGESRENLISLLDSATGMYRIRESTLVSPDIHGIVPLSSHSLVASSMQTAYFSTPLSPVEMLTNIYILWDEQNICDRIKYSSTFALYSPVSIGLSNGIVPRLGPLTLQSDTYVKAKYFKNFTTSEIKRDNGHSVAFQMTTT